MTIPWAHAKNGRMTQKGGNQDDRHTCEWMTLQKIQIDNDIIKFMNNKIHKERNMEDDEQQQYYDMYTFAKEQLRDLNQLKHLKNEIQILINGNKTNSDSKKIKVKIVTVLTKKQLE